MQVTSAADAYVNLTASAPAGGTAEAAQLTNAGTEERPTLREAFDAFVGQTFFSHLISAMRKTTGKPAYFHGGRAEEVFQGQLDQMLAERMSEASAEQFTGPMYELFTMGRPGN